MRTISLVWRGGGLSRAAPAPPFEDGQPRALVVVPGGTPADLASVRALVEDPGLVVTNRVPAGVRLLGRDGESWWRAVEEAPESLVVDPFVVQVHRVGRRTLACVDAVVEAERTDGIVASVTAALRRVPGLAEVTVPILVGSNARLFYLVPAERWQVGWDPAADVEGEKEP